MSDAWSLMSDVRCLMTDVRFLMSFFRCPIFDVQCPMFDVWRLMSKVRCLMADVWCPKSDERLISDVWYSTFDIWYPISDVWSPMFICLMSEVWVVTQGLNLRKSWQRHCVRNEHDLYNRKVYPFFIFAFEKQQQQLQTFLWAGLVYNLGDPGSEFENFYREVFHDFAGCPCPMYVASRSRR